MVVVFMILFIFSCANLTAMYGFLLTVGSFRYAHSKPTVVASLVVRAQALGHPAFQLLWCMGSVASLQVLELGFSSCATQGLLPHCTWDQSWIRRELTPPTLAGGFFTT